MWKTIASIALTLLSVSFAFSQVESDRVGDGLLGYVKAIKQETAEIIYKNGKPVENGRELDSVETYDIAGRKITGYTYTDGGKILYGDTFIYDSKGRHIETRTEHSKFTYLCDKKTKVYDQQGLLSEEVCHLTDRGPIGKTVYRYDSNRRLLEEERFPLVEAKLYFSRHSLRRYQYDAEGNLLESASFRKEGDQWLPEKESPYRYKTTYFSNTITRGSTSLKYEENGKLAFVVVSYEDDRGNEIETTEYFSDGRIKGGNRYEYLYDKHGNYIKETEYEWVIEDGKSFFQPSEAIYRTIEYFSEKEIRNFESKVKSTTHSPVKRQNTDQEEYAIYQAILESAFDRKVVEIIVVSRFTRIHSSIEVDAPLIADAWKTEIDSSAIEDFNRKNHRETWELIPDSFGKEVMLINESESREIFSDSENGWRKFYERHPKSQGISTFSRVGFNNERTRAIVYFGTQSDWLLGRGYMVIMQKRAAKWEVAVKKMIWIS